MTKEVGLVMSRRESELEKAGRHASRSTTSAIALEGNGLLALHAKMLLGRVQFSVMLSNFY